ncbi:MAG: ribonuclease III [Betaproteobacteria bacterium]|nr:ribonuclease III [Betaproteobacteria bacterium]
MSTVKNIDFDNLYNSLGYRFKSKDYLIQALTHRSVSRVNNERLEFLGDSLLNLITAEYLFLNNVDLSEGELSRLRSSYVNKDSLFLIANALKIKEYIHLSYGEKMGGGQNRPSILSDTVEAIIAAIYLDANYDSVKDVVIHWLERYVTSSIKSVSIKDPKTTLQELLQSQHKKLPIYQLIESTGLAHDQSFRVQCTITEFHIVTEGFGKSRRAAEQEAAQHAIEEINKLHG